MQFVAMEAIRLNGVDYAYGDVVPDTAFSDERLPYLIRRGLITPDTTVAGWDDLRVSVRAASPGASAPSLATFRDNGSGSTGVVAYSFSASQAQSVHFDVQLPHNWIGSGIRPHVHWSPGNSTNTGVVRWQLEYTWANPVNPPENTFPTTTLDVVDQAASGTAYAHQIAAFAEIVDADKRASSVLMCRLARLGNASEDTFTGAAFGLSVDFHIQVLGPGSGSEYPS